jgi:hypothetical protein
MVQEPNNIPHQPTAESMLISGMKIKKQDRIAVSFIMTIARLHFSIERESYDSPTE